MLRLTRTLAGAGVALIAALSCAAVTTVTDTAPAHEAGRVGGIFGGGTPGRLT